MEKDAMQRARARWIEDAELVRLREGLEDQVRAMRTERDAARAETVAAQGAREALVGRLRKELARVTAERDALLAKIHKSGASSPAATIPNTKEGTAP